MTVTGTNYTSAGDVTDPSTWAGATVYIGNGAEGTLTVDGGSTLSTGELRTGQGSGGLGTVTITGAGTTWNTGLFLAGGQIGGGTINITNGAVVSATNAYIGTYNGAGGTVTVDGVGSTLNAPTLILGGSQQVNRTLNIFNGATVNTGYFAVSGSTTVPAVVNFGANGGTLIAPSLPSNLATTQYTGTGTIATNAYLGDFDLLLDATHTLTRQTVATWNDTAYDGTTQNIAIQVIPGAYGDLAVGYKSSGSMTIREGSAFTSAGTTYIGHMAGSTGTAPIDGAGSTWTNSGGLYVGNSGTGTLSIINGATVSNTSASIGANTGSNGTVTVDGAGSTWTNSGSLTLGNAGTGTLNITNGGTVSVGGDTIVGPLGSINFGTTGGSLTTGSLLASASQLSGNGIITTSGIVGDMNVVFDASHGATQSFTANGSTINLNLTSSSALGAGYLGSGTLTIKDGVTVATSAGYLGYNTGSMGTAAITGSGSQWTNSGTLYVGNYGTGTMNITNGAGVSNAAAYLGYGYGTGSNGTVTVDGAGSTWTNTGTLYVADSGTGTVNITNGGSVSSPNAYVGHYSGSRGTVTVSGSGSTWTNAGDLYVGAVGEAETGALNITNGGVLTTGTLYASASQLSGNGTINTAGIVGDMNLVFDTSHGATQSFTANGVTINLSQSSTNVLGAGYIGSGSISIRDGVTVTSGTGYLGYNANSRGTATVTGTSSKWTNTGILYVGYSGTAAMTIADGGTVGNTYAYLGNNAGSTGTVTVDGANSTWTNSGGLYAGYYGTGKMTITSGGSVSNSVGYIGRYSGSTGTVTVDGKDANGTPSKWTNSGALNIGSSGTGRLSISDGGAVTATSVSIKAGSMLTADMWSSLTVGGGSGVIANAGTIRLVTGAGAASDTYTPMQYASMSGSGTVQALGGVWNDTDHTVTVSGAATANGVGGATAAFNLATAQRALITDSATGMSVGAAFQAGTADVTFTATAIGPTALAALQGLLASGNTVLSAWNFSTTGTTVSDTNPAYLSLFAGSGQSLSTLSLWYYDGSTWSAFTANDLAYDGTYASFTVTDFSGYAVSGSAPVPIPAAVWMLGPALAGLVGMRRRLFKK
jgi:T5SS/PEP-CTERM-associated repeat protein